jgi:hypothetical protein
VFLAVRISKCTARNPIIVHLLSVSPFVSATLVSGFLLS